MAYTPMFEKLINTKPERELCLKFLKFLEDKGIVQGDINPEETVAEFFSIDLEQAEKRTKSVNKRVSRSCGGKCTYSVRGAGENGTTKRMQKE